MITSSQSAERSVAVLSSNYPAHTLEAPITLRSGRRWVQVKEDIETYGRVPIYYRNASTEGTEVTQKGVVTEVVVDPEENPEEAKQLEGELPQGDTWEDYYKAATLYRLEEARDLPEPFPQEKLELRNGGTTVDSNFTRPYALVYEHSQY